MMTCEQALGRLNAYFVRRDGILPAVVDEHLATCNACRDAYHHLFEAEAALASSDSPAALSRAEKEMLLARVLTSPKPAAKRAVRWVLLASTAVAASVVALVFARDPVDEMTARGGNTTLADVSLRALCLSPAESGMTARSLAGGGPCHRNEALGFSYRNDTGQARYLQVIVRGSDGALRRAFPQAERVAPSAGELPIDATFALADLPPGLLTVYGLFSAVQLPAAPTLDRQALPAGTAIVAIEITLAEAAP